MRQRIAVIRNAAGETLYCVLQEPAAAKRRSDLACVLLSPGVKMRVAPHRLYRKLADVFLDRGIPVLRVDFHGLGDSTGDLAEQQLDQLYRQVQLGRHVGDVRSALDWLESEFGVHRFIAGGLCGGALTALLAAETDPRIAGLYGIGIPVILDGIYVDASKHMTRGQLTDMRRSYLRKLGDREAWLRFLSLRSDYRAVWRSLAVSFRGWAVRLTSGAGAGDADVPAPSRPPADNLNPRFPRAFFRLLNTGRAALLIFSGADRLQWEYDEKFAQPWADALAGFAALIDSKVIPRANHVLADPCWITAARELTADWLAERFPTEASPAICASNRKAVVVGR